MPKNKLQTLIRYLQAILIRGAGAIAAIALTISVSRNFSTIDARNWYIAINAITILGTCLRWGSDEIVIKRLAQTTNNENFDSALAGAISFLKTRLLYALALLAIVFLISAYPISNWLKLSIFDIALIVAPSAFVALLMSTGRLLQGLGLLNRAAFFLTVAAPMVTSVVILIFTSVEIISRWQEVVAIYAITTISLLPIAVKSLPTSGISPFKIVTDALRDQNSNRPNDSESHRSANILGFVVVATQGLPWMGASIVPIYFHAGAANAFIVSQKLSLSIGLIALVTNFAISRKVAEQFHSQQTRSILTIFLSGLAFISIGCGLVSAIAMFYAKEITMYANIEGQGSEAILLNLIISQIFFGIGTYCAVFLTMAGKESGLLKITIFINLIGCLLLLWSCMTQSISVVAVIYNLSYFLYAAFLIAIVFALLRKNIQVQKGKENAY